MSADARPRAEAPKSLDRALVRGLFFVGAFAAVTSVARLAQDAAIAWRFGTGPAVDAYYFVSSLVNWPVAVALSVFMLLVGSVEVGQRQKGRLDEVQRFRRELLGALLLLAVLSLPAAWAILRTVAGGPLGGLEDRTAKLALAGIPWIVAVVPIGLVGALLAAWLVAAGRHVLTLLEALPPLVLTLALLLSAPGPVLFWATAVGVAIQAVAMTATLRAMRAMPAPSLGFGSAAWHGVAASGLLLVAAQVISALLPLVDAFFAARLGEGTLTTLNFANRIVLGLQGLTGLALQRASLPLLAPMLASAPQHAYRAVVRWAGLMALLGLAIGMVVAALADPLVALLFERGRFGADDREQVATLLRWGVLQLAPYLAAVPVVTALAAISARSLVIAAATGLAVKVSLSGLLAAGLGAVGLQVGTAAMYTTAALVAWLALRRHLRVEGAGQSLVQ